MNSTCKAVAWLVMTLSTLVPSGCTTTLPVHPPLGDSESLRLIAARLGSVKSISTSVDLTLTSAQGQTVSLEGAFVARPPDRARLRAWKFGTPVLDITILPEGVWAYAAPRPGSSPAELTTLPSAGIRQSIDLLSGSYFARARVVEGEASNATMVVVGPAFGHRDAKCEIDRATLTPRRFVLNDGGAGTELVLDRYAMVGEVAWAQRMEFRAADGTIVIRLGDVELNGDLPESAFVPPGRAVRLP